MQLKRTLGPVQLTFYSVGLIIGAGVYSIIGTAAGIAGNGLWFSFLLGAVVAVLTGLSYAEMTTSFPKAGAEYTYVSQTWPGQDWLAFTVAMIMLLGGSATACTVAMAFGGYLQEFISIPPAVAAGALLIGCTALSILGLQESSIANIVFTCVEIGGLLLVIVAGMTQPDFGAPLHEMPHAGAVTAAATLFFVYLGFEEIANMAEEVRDPGRNLPRAIFASVALTTVLYVLVALAVLALASPNELAESNAPLATAIFKVWPNSGALLAAIALFSTANTVLITLIATSRLLFSLSRDGMIHTAFSSLGGRGQTPALATGLTLVLAVALIPLGNIRLLAEISSLAALLAFLSVNLTLIVLRYRSPEQVRPFRVPVAIGKLPVAPVAAIISIGVLMFNFEWQIYLAGILAIVAAIVFWFMQPYLASRSRR